jgi:hypothetical protein
MSKKKTSRLFKTPDFNLKFNGPANPIKQGCHTRIVQEVPEATSAYTNNALKKLCNIRPKCLATGFGNVTAAQKSELTSQPLQTVTPFNSP